MSTPFKLLSPIVEKVAISKPYNPADFPSFLLPLISSYDTVWKVTITPQMVRSNEPQNLPPAVLDVMKGPCRLVISAPFDGKNGAINLQNLGRIPASTPVPTADDLRPISYIVFGDGGSQRFDVIYPKYSSVRVSETVSFP